MKCPSRSLENPSTAVRCDCGYSFSSAKADSAFYLHSLDRSVRIIKWIVVSWAAITVIGMFIWIAVSVASPSKYSAGEQSSSTGQAGVTKHP